MNQPASLLITDISPRPRLGFKGAAAATWLQTNGFSVPEQANTWQLSQGVLLMRLGAGEFLIEAEADNACWPRLNQSTDLTQLYPVPRYDAAWLLEGQQALTLLAELCLLDLQALTDQNALCMTQIAGINAIVLRLPKQNTPQYYVLCDGSYQHYMRDCLRLQQAP